jgi:hypothetical protein
MWSNPELGRRRFCPVLLHTFARLAAGLPSGTLRRLIAGEVYDRDPQAVFDALGPRINAHMSLAHLAFDLEPADHLDFEDLAGLMPGTPLSFGVALMTLASSPFVWTGTPLRRPHGDRDRPLQGRCDASDRRGDGSQCTLWSIDTGALEPRRPLCGRGESFDDQLPDVRALRG